MAGTLDAVVEEIRRVQTTARRGGRAERPRWPMIVLRSPKGWTGPEEVDGKKTQGFWRSHQVPMGEMHDNPAHVKRLEDWMKSYRPQELFDATGAVHAAVAFDNASMHEQVVAQRALQRDLELARRMQRTLLPSKPPQVPGYFFFDYYQAARQVGGDYYDYVQLPGGRFAVIVGDVAGKGMPAALLMARLYSSARYQLLTSAAPGKAISGLNQEIVSSGLGHRFVTFLVMITGGLFFYVGLIVVGLAAMGGLHYLLWGKLLQERTAGEREEAELLARAKAEDSKPSRPYRG